MSEENNDEFEPCPLCWNKVPGKQSPRDQIFRTECPYCGSFEMGYRVYNALKNNPFTPRQVANARAYLKENPGLPKLTTQELVDILRGLSAPSVMEKAQKLLAFIAKKHPDVASRFVVPPVKGPIVGTAKNLGMDLGETAQPFSLEELAIACWCLDRAEVEYLLVEVLQKELGFVNFAKTMGAIGVSSMTEVELGTGTITPKGWVALDTTAKAEVPGECFVAMWFDPAIKYLFDEAIYPGARDAGYKAKKVNDVHFNDSVTDEIIAGIRRGKFVISDFTGQRGGVYFEAGFALGLGKQVIWLVRKDETPNLHFDTRQYNFIEWTPDKLPELQKVLTLRIQATIGQGPWVGTDSAATNNS